MALEKPGEQSDVPADDPVAALTVMLEVLDRASLAEVERAMALTLHPQKTAREKRVGELGFLASLLNDMHVPSHLMFPVIERERYDESRPRSAPLSARLVERYGSWRRTCYHAYGLLPDGRWRGPGNPWRIHLRGKEMPPDYQRHEIRTALRQCAFALCMRPTSSTYFRWAAAKRARALERGLTLRLPTSRSLYRHYPAKEGGFNAALRDAEIIEEELDEAWAARLDLEADPEALTPSDYLAAMTLEDFIAAGLRKETARTLGRLGANAVMELELQDAVKLALWIGASLEWLAAATKTIGEPLMAGAAVDVRLDVGVVSARRKELGVAEADVRKALNLQLGPYRRMMRGKREIHFGEVLALAKILRSPATDLIAQKRFRARRLQVSRLHPPTSSGLTSSGRSQSAVSVP